MCTLSFYQRPQDIPPLSAGYEEVPTDPHLGDIVDNKGKSPNDWYLEQRFVILNARKKQSEQPSSGMEYSAVALDALSHRFFSFNGKLLNLQPFEVVQITKRNFFARFRVEGRPVETYRCELFKHIYRKKAAAQPPYEEIKLIALVAPALEEYTRCTLLIEHFLEKRQEPDAIELLQAIQGRLSPQDYIFLYEIANHNQAYRFVGGVSERCPPRPPHLFMPDMDILDRNFALDRLVADLARAQVLVKQSTFNGVAEQFTRVENWNFSLIQEAQDLYNCICEMGTPRFTLPQIVSVLQDDVSSLSFIVCKGVISTLECEVPKFYIPKKTYRKPNNLLPTAFALEAVKLFVGANLSNWEIVAAEGSLLFKPVRAPGSTFVRTFRSKESIKQAFLTLVQPNAREQFLSQFDDSFDAGTNYRQYQLQRYPATKPPIAHTYERQVATIKIPAII